MLQGIKKMIFVVDDSDTNLAMAKQVLEKQFKVMTVSTGERLFSLLEKFRPDLILLDIEMPVMNGFEILERMKNSEGLKDIPIIFLTSLRDSKVEVRGLEMGIVDFISKPFSGPVLLNRVRVHLEVDAIIRERTAQAENMHYNMMFVLADLVESRDEKSGGHIWRTTRFMKALKQAMIDSDIYVDEMKQLDDKTIESAAMLHDIGKISIPDEILKKTDKFEPAEFEVMRTHAVKGEIIIETMIARTGGNKLLENAKYFAAYHHEKWDGTGYPYGLKGMDIPIQGRMMAVVDFYDNLIMSRPGKSALSDEEAMEIMMMEVGTYFDPEIGRVLPELGDKFAEIRRAWENGGDSFELELELELEL
ncbi:MAG: response regulator [Defluviitaleaceae bacterium]|nr:response regulator [Defluviitaleaceae bacterium]